MPCSAWCYIPDQFQAIEGKGRDGAQISGESPSPAFRPFLIRPHRPAAFLGRNEISSALQSLGIYSQVLGWAEIVRQWGTFLVAD
jgi:hypothetical protein